MSEALAEKAPAKSTEGAGLTSAVHPIPLPRIFGRLLLLKLLARGGMGDVYLAATTGIEGAERPIVVKTIRRDHIHDGSFLARFLDEARVQSQLNHPGVAQILEASTDDNGEPYTVVEYVEGRSLADLRHRAVQIGARIGWPEAVAITIEMGTALAHVHERAGADGAPLGIVHRDLSPQNVMIGYAGEVKLIDFGTARGHNRRCHTVAGVVFAKPGYVAPEVARQQVGDGRIDVYAMGVMLWELCAGKRLLSGDPQRHLEEVAKGSFDIPRLAGSRGIPQELDEIIQRLCADDPDDRYTNAAQASSELARVLSHAPAGKNGERSVRARISALMKALWPNEPARLRAEFAKLLKQARGLRREPETPPSERSLQLAARAAGEDPAMLSGTSYRLGRKIGEGASGEVFEAEHVELERRYAVKVLSSAHAAATDAVDRFRKEARTIAALSHPSFVRLHDFGRSLDGRVFLVMELLQGKTLDVHADLENEVGLPWREAVLLSIEVSRALEAAHDAGLVHRDLKPQNLFLTSDGGLKLLDFGVAMALADTEGTEKRQKGFAVFGTPEYMAPEQVAGETVDARCDVYALGCVLYQLVAGTPPFVGSPVVVMGKQLREQPERPRVRLGDSSLPLAIEEVILKALAKKKEDRWPSAKAMREALEHALAEPVRRKARQRRLATSVMLGTFVLSFGILAKGYGHELTARFFRAAPAAAAPALEAASATTTAAETPPAATPEPAPLAPVVAETAPVEESKGEAEPDGPKNAPKGEAHASKPAGDAPKPAAETPSSPSPLLVRASARHSDAETKARLDEARVAAKEHTSDPKALRAWAVAALAAGEVKEARRAGEAWAAHDTGIEPRLFLATALEANGRRREARAVLDEWLANHPDATEAKKMRERLGATPEPVIKRGRPARAPHADE